ncbi:MAG: EAL domain-containing protein [Phycisphaerales bacterium]
MPHSAHLLRQLLDVTVSSELDFDDQIERILLRGCRELDMELGILAEIQGDTYCVRATVPMSDLEVEHGATYPLGRTYCRETVRSNDAVGFHEATGSDWEGHPAFEDFQLEAYVGAPVMVSGRLYGTLNFSRRTRRDRPISEEELDFVRFAAAWAGSELAREHSRRETARAREELGAVLHSSIDGVMAFESVRDERDAIVDFRWTLMNPAAGEIVGRSPVDLLGRLMLEELPGNKADGPFDRYRRVVETSQPAQFEHHYRHDGIDSWFRISAVKTGDGFAVGFADITESKAAEARVLEAQRELQTILDTVPSLIWYKDAESRIIRTNRAVAEAMQLSTDEIEGMETADAHPGEAAAYVRDDAEVVRTGVPKRGIIERVRFGPLDERWMSTDKVPVRGPSGDIERILIVATDITRLKRTEDALRRLAEFDPLTDLRNRASFTQQLERALLRARRDPAERFALLYLDFDRFKIVNDSLGHHAGDALLQSIADRIRRAIQPEEVAARLGGDEFAILLRNIDSIETAVAVAERLLTVFGEAHRIEGVPIVSTASIGAAFSGDGDPKAADLLRDADGAMYQAKAGGRNRVVAVTDEARAQAQRRLVIEQDLRKILGEDRLEFAFLPIYRVSDGAIVGFETLARWPGDAVTPREFIPVAIDSGLIGDIGARAVSEGASCLREWSELLPEGGFVTVKCSSREVFHPGTAPALAQTIAEAGVDAASLVLEIEESVLAETRADVRGALRALRDTGVRIAVDNFGAGASSLRVLRDGVVDVVKIDRSFLADSADPETDRAMLQTIVSLAHRFGLPTVAEGVRDESQWELLRSLACEMGQGHGLSRPLTRAEAGAALAEGVRRAA